MFRKSFLVVSGEQQGLSGGQDFGRRHPLEGKLFQRLLIDGDAFTGQDLEPGAVGGADEPHEAGRVVRDDLTENGLYRAQEIIQGHGAQYDLAVDGDQGVAFFGRQDRSQDRCDMKAEHVEKRPVLFRKETGSSRRDGDHHGLGLGGCAGLGFSRYPDR